MITGDWFWNSIQIQAAAKVTNYQWNKAGLMSPANKSVFSPPTPSSLGATSRKRKRQRRAEVINALAAADSPAHKRRSSVSELGLLSMSSSYLDTSCGPLSPEPAAAPASGIVERGAVLATPGEPEG